MALAALVVGGCRDKDPETARPTTVPPPVETTPATTAATTTTKPSPPRTTATLSVEIVPGTARISGTVLGPAGPVAGATVRVERFVGSEVATMDVNAGDGTFSLLSIRGGRYRVRAWKQPDLVQTEPEAFFLAADEARTVELRVTRVAEVAAQAKADPERPRVGETFTMTVFLYAGVVTDQGIVQAYGRADVPVQIVVGPGLVLQSPDQAVTDGGGNASFAAACQSPGQHSAEIVVVGTPYRTPLTLPACEG